MIPSMVAVYVLWKDRILLLQRKPEGRFPLMWCCPGGKVEEGEELFDAAMRELKEEAGIEPDPYAVCHAWDYPTQDGQKMVRAYVMEIKDRLDITLEDHFVGYGWFLIVGGLPIPAIMDQEGLNRYLPTRRVK